MFRTPCRRTAAIGLAGLLAGALACDFSPGDPYGGGLPRAAIFLPENGAVFVAGDTVTFSGSGSDDEDGQLAGGALVWTSSLQGQLGTGTRFTRTDVQVGQHVIRLRVTDSDGEQATDEVAITVTN